MKRVRCDCLWLTTCTWPVTAYVAATWWLIKNTFTLPLITLTLTLTLNSSILRVAFLNYLMVQNYLPILSSHIWHIFDMYICHKYMSYMFAYLCAVYVNMWTVFHICLHMFTYVMTMDNIHRESKQEAQLSLRDRATRACQLKSGKVLHKCRRLVFEKLWN